MNYDFMGETARKSKRNQRFIYAIVGVFLAAIVGFGVFFLVKGLKGELKFNTSYEELSRRYEEMLNSTSDTSTDDNRG